MATETFTAPESRSVDARGEFVDMTMELVAEYAGTVPAGSVIRCVSRCRAVLLRAGVQGAGLLTATEHMARARLRQLSGPGLLLSV